MFWHMGHQRGFTKPLIQKKCPFPLKELSRISHASPFPALAVVWQLLLDLLRLPSSQSRPSPPSSPLSPRVWLDSEGGGGPLSLFSLSLSSLMFLIDSMWQLHGRLQSHPFSPKGRCRCLSPGSTSPHCPPQIGLPPPPPHPTSRTAHETLGTFISKQAPCSIQLLSSPLHCSALAAAWSRMFGILLTSNFNMCRSLCLRRLPAFVCSYRWGTDSWLVYTCMCWAALEAFVAKSWVSLAVGSVSGLSVQTVSIRLCI